MDNNMGDKTDATIVQSPQPTETPAPVHNPLLDRLRIPGTSFRLPSQGLFYENGELASSTTNGELEVYPMTAIDEVILATPDKLLSGKAIEEVFTRCIPQVVKPRDLLARDVDFLMMCLRNVTFGATMEVKYKHECENALNHTYMINIDQLIKTVKQIDPTTISKEYTLTMDNGQVVKLKPLTFATIIDLYQSTAFSKQEEDFSQEEAETMIIRSISSAIKSVDNIEDVSMIEGWVRSISLGWKRQIEQQVQQISNWGMDFEVKDHCKDCKEEITLQITANPISFFI